MKKLKRLSELKIQIWELENENKVGIVTGLAWTEFEEF